MIKVFIGSHAKFARCEPVIKYSIEKEVMVVNCAKKTSIKIIPPEWNIEDYSATPEDLKTAKIIHFTDLKTQPWFYEHPKPWLSKIWFDMEREAIEANKKSI